jgi:hypothetical protein
MAGQSRDSADSLPAFVAMQQAVIAVGQILPVTNGPAAGD